VCILYCVLTVFVLCVYLYVWVCVCVGFIMCGLVYVWVCVCVGALTIVWVFW